MFVYYTLKKVKEEYKNNKFKTTAPNWDETFDLPDRSYNISQIQNYFEFIMKKHETITDENYPIRIYCNYIKNRIVFKIKTGYKLELSTNETMELLGDGSIIDRDKNSNSLPQLEIFTTVLVNCNIVEKQYQQANKVIYSFISDKSFGQLISIHPSSLIKLKTTISIHPSFLIRLKTTDSEFNFIEVWLTDQNNKPLESEDIVNITLIIGPSSL